MIAASRLISEARSFLGTPYRHQGRSQAGVDCIGLIILTASNLDLLPDGFSAPANYRRLPGNGMLKAQIARYCKPCELVPGSVLLMRWKVKDEPSHCAIYTGETIIHAYKNVEVVTEHGFRGHWPERLESCWALPGVDL